MLKHLRLKNIVLIEEAEIPFQSGFNVISGETGSGKSALMAALQQIQGARADLELIRHGFEQGVIEAVFDLDMLPEVQDKLHHMGIEHEEGDELIIRRELCKTGKSRLFINNQLAHLSTLRTIASALFEIIGQYASQQLFELSHHLEILDLYGGLQDLKEKYRENFAKEADKRERLKRLQESEQRRLREVDSCLKELEELNDADLKEGEEEELFTAYSRLTNVETLAQLSDKIAFTLEEHVLPTLRPLTPASEELHALDPSLEEAHRLMQSLCIELEELAHTFRHYHSSIEHDPYQAEAINQRLSVIHQIKKKYGETVSQAIQYREERQQELHVLENAEQEIEGLKEELKRIEQESETQALALTKARKQAASLFSKAMTDELQSLNMPHAVFFVEVAEEARTRLGQDRVEFFFAPNKGEKRVSIRSCASGGEISRLLLSIQTLLAGKKEMPCVVFDEMDANIGGHTAGIVGRKLQQIGSDHQLLCITHFPQVADAAAHHIRISKSEQGERTVTEVAVLNKQARQSELLRMVGK